MNEKNPCAGFSRQLKAVADPNRLLIIVRLTRGEQSASQLCRDLHICQPTFSHHMKILCEKKLVLCRREGIRRFYRLNTDVVRNFAALITEIADATDTGTVDQDALQNYLNTL